MKTSTIKEIRSDFIHLNTICNQKCIFCGRPPKKNQNRTYGLDGIKKRIKEISSDLNSKRVVFTGGEPLLHPQLSDAIRYAKKLGLLTEIQTNGTLLKKNIVELKRSGLDILDFAFPSHKKDISNRLRGVNTGFEETIENLKLANKMGFQINIIHVINSLNYQDLPEFVDFINNLDLKNFWFNFCLICPVGWAWKNKLIVPRMKDVKPYLIKAMKNCERYDYEFNISDIVPLCCVDGFEDHAISTIVKISKIKVINGHLVNKNGRGSGDIDKINAVKAPQCDQCKLNIICAGFHPAMESLFGVEDYIPQKDDPILIYKKVVNK